MSLLNSTYFKGFFWKEVRNNLFLKFALFAFIVVAFTFSETGLMPVFAVLLLIAILIKGQKFILRKAGKFPPELKCLNVWVVWSVITGVLVSSNKELFLNSSRTIILMVATVNMFYVILAYDFKLIKTIVLAIFICGLIQLAGIYLGLKPVENVDKIREYGFASNPNSFGLRMVYASMPIFLFLGNKKITSIFLWIISIVLLNIFLKEILASGSRKSVIAFFTLIVGFIGIYSINKLKKFRIFLFVVMVAVFGFLAKVIVPQVLEGSIVGERFEMLEDKGGVQGDIRYEMYVYGLNLFMDNPVVGVGLNNYRDYFHTGQYSHSDYVESLTSTGLVGFVLYQSFFLIVFLRGYKLFPLISSKKIRFYVLMSAFIVIVIKIIALGIILYSSPPTMIIMACVMSYTFLLKRELVNAQKVEEIHL